MKIRRLYLIIIAAVIIGCTQKQLDEPAAVKQTKIKVEDQLVSPKLENVKLQGVVGEEMKKILQKRVLSENAQSEIIQEATNAFKTQMDGEFHKDQNRGVWQGEFWGKWILSAVAAYQYTGDRKLKETIRKETFDLIATQRGDGYIGTYRNSAFVTGNTWNVWCRKYTLWGLVEAYEILGEAKILEAAKRHMDHLMIEVGSGKIEMVNTGNFVGLPSSSILTPLVKLYLHTSEQKYLDYAVYIIDNWGLNVGNPPDIISKGQSSEPVHLWFPEAGKWTKAYEFISCIEGLVDLYQVVGNEKYLTAAKNVYKAIQENERVITGGIGYHDKLNGASFMPEGLNEPCDVVYWERLSAKMLRLTGDQHYADEIERLAYNTLLGAFNYEGNWAVRRMGLNEPHLVAPLHCFTKHHQCCVANIPRGMLQLAEVAVMSGKTQNNLYINLFLPGSYKVSLPDKTELQFKIVTEYPKSGEIKIIFENEEVTTARLHIRKPEWCERAGIKVNKEAINDMESENQWEIAGTWGKGKEIILQLEMPGRIVSLPDQPNFKAIMRGPIVLARSSMLEGDAIDEPIKLTDRSINLKSIPKAEHLEEAWLAFELVLEGGKVVKLCDYASTGKNFDKPNDPYALKAMMNNRVSTDQRVWLKTF
ncbi:MAG: beta-L-arabinofuranosidase domain-containing protein [Bacteroidota bacterium]